MWYLVGVEILCNSWNCKSSQHSASNKYRSRSLCCVPVSKVWWRSGWCFPHLMKVGMLDELMAPRDGFVQAGCQHVLWTQAPALTPVNTCSSNFSGLILQLPFSPQSPGDLLLVPLHPSTATLPSLIWRLDPGVAYRILHQLKRESRLLTIVIIEATHNEWKEMKSRWSEGESLNVNMSSV